MLCSDCILLTTGLLICANGAPVLLQNIAGNFCKLPIDFGYQLADQRPLFGESKTWRGVIFSTLATSLLASFLGLSWVMGVGFALLAMSGDLLSSFIKRRLGYAPSSRCRWLDALPESLLPALIMQQSLHLSYADITCVVLLFFLLEVGFSPLLYRLHIRKRPY
jgi:CDP-archaeol synthase